MPRVDKPWSSSPTATKLSTPGVLVAAGLGIAVLALLAVLHFPAPTRQERPGTVDPAIASVPIASIPAVVPPPPERAAKAADEAKNVTERPIRAAVKKPTAAREEKALVAASPSADSPSGGPSAAEDVPVRSDAPELSGLAPAASPAAAEAIGPAPVTITGCLEVSVDDNLFRLTDAEGSDVPKARSWRSGFFRKRSAPVSLVEPPDPSALRTMVGHRVSATGVLSNRELRLRSLRALAPSCD